MTMTPSSTYDDSCELLGGPLRRIPMEGESDGVMAVHSVPTFAAFPSHGDGTGRRWKDEHRHRQMPHKRSLEDSIMAGTFHLWHALSPTICEDLIDLCEHDLQFGQYHAGKNNHGAMQIVVSPPVAHAIATILQPHVTLHHDHNTPTTIPIIQPPPSKTTPTTTTTHPRHHHHPLQTYADTIQPHTNNHNNNHNSSSSSSSLPQQTFQFAGINRRWRFYRYQPGGEERFAPHIDCGFPPSAISSDGTTMIWDARQKDHDDTDTTTPPITTDVTYDANTMSRLTVLMYLNDDFDGGHTVFYHPPSSSQSSQSQPPPKITSVQPKAGSILVFPQAVGDDAKEYAEQFWPLHEGSPVQSGSNRPKYVIRSDILITTIRNNS